MSALSDLSAALPAESGGPDAHRVAAAARILVEGMPRGQRVAVGVGLGAIEAASIASSGRTLGRRGSPSRARFLERLAKSNPAARASVDGLKTLVLMAAGGMEFAGEIRTTASRHPVSKADPPLRLRRAEDIGSGESFDAIVVGSGAGGAFAALELVGAGHRVLIVEEGEHWSSGRIRATSSLERFASLYRDAGSTIALGSPPIALPTGRAVGGTTVVNSGTCYRPPAKVVQIWRSAGLNLAGEGFEERVGAVEEMIGVGPVPARSWAETVSWRCRGRGARVVGGTTSPQCSRMPGCVPVRDWLPQQRQGGCAHERSARGL